MRKSIVQLKWEAQLAHRNRRAAEMKYRKQRRRARGISHPANPAGDGDGWTIRCERRGCEVEFFTTSKQQRYCSTGCRERVDSWRKKQAYERERIATRSCAAPNCSQKFAPIRDGHRFCCTACRKRGHRDAMNLNTGYCIECGKPHGGADPRRRYCSDRCKMTYHRKSKETDKP